MISDGRSRPRTVMRSGVLQPSSLRRGFGVRATSGSFPGEIYGALFEGRVLAQLELGDPVRRRARQLVDEEDEAWHLESRKAGTAPLAEIALGQGAAGFSHYREKDLVLAQLGGDADRRRFDHLRMVADHEVDLGPRDVLAATADDVLLARDEPEVAVFIPTREVAGQEVAVAESGRGRFGVAVVALHRSEERRVG